MNAERHPKAEFGEEDIPKHETLIKPENLLRALESIVVARRALNAAVKVVTDPRNSFGPGGVEEFMEGAVSRNQIADGMVAALDFVAPLSDGNSWGEVTNSLAERDEPTQYSN